MKNYLYKVELFTGLFESYFFNQIKAANEKAAIIELVATFLNKYEADASRLLNKTLGRNWKVEKFWKDMDMRFLSEDGSVGHTLIWLKEINYDLETF